MDSCAVAMCCTSQKVDTARSWSFSNVLLTDQTACPAKLSTRMSTTLLADTGRSLIGRPFNTSILTTLVSYTVIRSNTIIPPTFLNMRFIQMTMNTRHARQSVLLLYLPLPAHRFNSSPLKPFLLICIRPSTLPDKKCLEPHPSPLLHQSMLYKPT